MNSKRKGSAGERELLAILIEAGLLANRNDQTYKGGKDNPDIGFEAMGVKWHVECKRTEKFRLNDAMEQAERDANGHAVPLVMHRYSRKPWSVTMKLNDFLRMVRPDASKEKL